MKRIYRIAKQTGIATGLLVLALSHCHGQDPSQAVVRIFTVRPGSSATSLGAGVFISGTGDVLTAYHVVQGASAVDIYSAAKKCGDVQLVAYDEAQDLALLNCKLNGGPSVYAKIAEVPAHLITKSGEALGFPEGKPLSHVSVNFLQDAPIRGEQYYVAGKQIFTVAAWKVGLLNIDATLPPGMSGAPVVVDGRVIAVVSGSEELRSRAPGWAMIAANARGLKPAKDPRRFDNTPKLTMLLNPYLDSKSPLLKMALGAAGAQRLILREERLEGLRVAAAELDSRYGALLERLPRSFEPGPNSVTPGHFGRDMLYGKLAENALSAADEYKGIYEGYLGLLQDLLSVNSDTDTVWDQVSNELNGAKVDLTPEILERFLTFELLQRSDSDLDKAIRQSSKTEENLYQRIPQMRIELQQLVSNAPKDPIDELKKLRDRAASSPKRQAAGVSLGCEECAVKSVALLTAVASQAMRGPLILEGSLVGGRDAAKGSEDSDPAQ